MGPSKVTRPHPIGYYGVVALRFRPGFLILVVLVFFQASWARYKPKELTVLPAIEYPAHQDFQRIVIGAFPCSTLESSLSLFDTKKLHEKGFLPVLLVIENDNAFPVRIREKDIYLVTPGEPRQQPVPVLEVLLQINLKKPLSNMSGKKELLLEKVVEKEMRSDFEAKAFLERTVEASSTCHGVVFYRKPSPSKMAEVKLYFPEVVNLETSKPLIFFEFNLFGP